MTFKAYMTNIQAKTGKIAADFWKRTKEEGFIEEGKITATHAELPRWFKYEIGLGHVHANFMIAHPRLRTNDPKLSDKKREWTHSKGYKEGEKP